MKLKIILDNLIEDVLSLESCPAREGQMRGADNSEAGADRRPSANPAPRCPREPGAQALSVILVLF